MMQSGFAEYQIINNSLTILVILKIVPKLHHQKNHK
jgi:hypothetical protein